MEPDASQLRGQFLRFFSNPAIGIAGSLASIVGLVLAVYFYNAVRTTRMLVYFAHPAMAAVVKAGQSSRLHITLDGAPVERDVIVAQIAFWNEGEESIRSENMLRPLVIRISPTAQILEARVRKASRSVVDLNLDPASINEGEVPIGQKILEHRDGGIVQLIYLRDVDALISATATVEGKGDIRALGYGGSAEQYRQRGKFEKLCGYLYLAVGLLMGIYGVLRVRRRRSRDAPIDRFVIAIYVGMPVLTIGMALFMIFWFAATPGPLFGFE